MFSAYLPHLLYSVAITSISLHLVYRRRFFSEQKARIDARESVLQSIVDELRTEKPLAPEELQRLRRLARTSEGVTYNERFSWKEVLLGRIGTESGERKD
ncbi:hypothetical protein L218DRAFT_513838 [Marasmius fiardii PR-910]|nr:hypothetical protein L218DRAFT_513838 [Marasmius fiardii PR-910]